VLLAEAVAVGLAEGARLGPEGVSVTLAFCDRLRDEVESSMLYDRLSGRELENELLSGAITRLGRRHGVPTPATRPWTGWAAAGCGWEFRLSAGLIGFAWFVRPRLGSRRRPAGTLARVTS
jgi:Ketopantoate reductase PanE/ApbA C terminal